MQRAFVKLWVFDGGAGSEIVIDLRTDHLRGAPTSRSRRLHAKKHVIGIAASVLRPLMSLHAIDRRGVDARARNSASMACKLNAIAQTQAHELTGCCA